MPIYEYNISFIFIFFIGFLFSSAINSESYYLSSNLIDYHMIASNIVHIGFHDLNF